MSLQEPDRAPKGAHGRRIASFVRDRSAAPQNLRAMTLHPATSSGSDHHALGRELDAIEGTPRAARAVIRYKRRISSMKKSTQTPAKPSTRLAKLDDADLVKIIGGCTNENLTKVVIK